MPVGFGLFALQLTLNLFEVLLTPAENSRRREYALMDPLVLGLLVATVTILILFSGISVANGLLVVSAIFLLTFDGFPVIGVNSRGIVWEA